MSENIKPRFEVHKLDGKGMRRIATPKIKVDEKGKPVKNKDGNSILLGGFEYEDIEVDAGWMVYFPSGSSIHIWTQEEMERQGFLKNPDMIDMETGDAVAPTSDISLKDRSEQKEVATKSSRSPHTL